MMAGSKSPLRVPIQSFERGKSHGGIVGDTVFDRADAGAVAHVADNGVDIRGLLAHEGRGPFGDVEKTGAVEAVFTDTVLLIPLVGEGVHVGALRHCLMPGGVHHRAVSGVGQNISGGFDALDIGRIVQRGQIGYFLKGLQRFIVDNDRLVELVASLYDSMAYSLDVVHVLQNPVGRVEEGVDNQFNGRLVVGALLIFSVGVFTGGIVLNG